MPISDTTARWFQRFGFPFHWPDISIRPETRLCVVIPALAEPSLEQTLQSLKACSQPSYPVDVLVVLNYPAGSDASVLSGYQENLKLCVRWEHESSRDILRFITVRAPALPAKWAGAGLSRKAGMDFVVQYTDGSTLCDPLIVCLDADCTVSANYLMELEKMHALSTIEACSLFFEHRISEITDSFQRKIVADYELYLRYYVQALRWAGYPFSWHTVGSSMAVRCSAYMKYGGMNRRKAGEDFYFLHKIIPHGRFADATSLTVYPSGRPSFRVPFGTGKTVSDRLTSGDRDYLVYHPEIFAIIRQWLNLVIQGNDAVNALTDWEKSTPEPIAMYLTGRQFSVLINEWKNNSASDSTFLRRFFHWLDGFEMLKLVHFLRDSYFGTREISASASDLLVWINPDFCPPENQNSEDLLSIYREIDRTDNWPIKEH